MKVKAVDIARELGISKATVSLALNNKPGVSEQTRKDIFSCREQMSQGYTKRQKIPERNQILKVIIAGRDLKVAWDSELDLWTDVLAIFDSEAKDMGYSVGVTYVNILKDDIDTVIAECNQDFVAGVILEATELYPKDWEIFKKIIKPMVIYDSDLEISNHYCIAADNRGGVKLAMEYLFERNKKKIEYLANDINIYNFDQRRKAYNEFLDEHNLTENRKIISLGTTIESVYRNMKEYIVCHNLPEAFLMENYQVSIGVMRALREKKISVPNDISLIGIDEVPDYITGYCKLTVVKVPHTERARLVMLFLQREIEKKLGIKSKVFTNCKLIEGDTVS